MENKPTGFLLVDKPAGITSHDVVDKLRKITGIKKIGHAGTLDPFATGLLIMAIGRESTREISKFVGMDKEYVADIILGATTETLDSEAEVQISSQNTVVSSQEITKAMAGLTGEIDQIPPMYSAIKVKGKKLYELARKGEEIKREPRKVTIHKFKMIGEPEDFNNLQKINAKIKCSSGTYIRALARDLGEKLNTGAYLQNLRRISIGDYKIENAHQIQNINSDNWTELLIHDKLFA